MRKSNETREAVRHALLTNPAAPLRELAGNLEISISSVYLHAKELERRGEIERAPCEYCGAKRWYDTRKKAVNE